MIHEIAISDFDTAIGITELRKDIEMFNPKLRLTTLSRWVTPRENRIGKMHGSVMLSFDNEKMHQWSLRGKLFVGRIHISFTIFGIPHNFTNWLALLLQVDSLERPSFT
jgi:hypothetical protein